MINLNDIKQIPILLVADKLSINHKNGRDNIPCFKGHDDNTNSLRFDVKNNKFHCFGCLIGGDNIDLVCKFLNIEIGKAIEWFKNNFNIMENKYNNSIYFEKQGTSKPLNSKIEVSVIKKLYTLIMQGMTQIKGGYIIEERGIGVNVANENFIVMNKKSRIYDNIKHKKGVNEDNYIYSYIGYILLEKLGIDSSLIKEYISVSGLMPVLHSQYIIPFFVGDDVCYMQGVNVGKQKEEYGKYSYLKGIEKPMLYIPKSLQDENGDMIEIQDSSVFVTEGIIDTLSLLTLGIPSVAILDVGLKKDDKKLIGLNKIIKNKISLILDADAPGEKAKAIMYKYMVENHFEVKIRSIKTIAEKAGVSDFNKIKDSNDFLMKVKKLK